MVAYLLLVMTKQYRDSILLIFELYYQDLVKDIIQVNRISMTTQEKELENSLEEELNQLKIEGMDNEITSNKYLYPTLENDTSVELFTMKEFGLKN